MKIFIVGKKSIIAKNLFLFFKKKNNVKLIDYKDINFKNKNFTIINCSSKKIQLKKNVMDRDIKIINKIKKDNIFHYIMLSTSKVYGGKKIIKDENHVCRPKNLYGIQRLKVEKQIKKILPDNNFTILRLSNVINFDLRKKSYSKTFMNRMLRDLKYKNLIKIPQEETYKDFIGEKNVFEIINIIIKSKIFGLYNLSSGISISASTIAKNLIKGYGKNIKIYRDHRLKTDNFTLSNKKLYKLTKYRVLKKDLINQIYNLGKNLRNV